MSENLTAHPSQFYPITPEGTAAQNKAEVERLKAQLQRRRRVGNVAVGFQLGAAENAKESPTTTVGAETNSTDKWEARNDALGRLRLPETTDPWDATRGEPEREGLKTVIHSGVHQLHSDIAAAKGSGTAALHDAYQVRNEAYNMIESGEAAAIADSSGAVDHAVSGLARPPASGGATK